MEITAVNPPLLHPAESKTASPGALPAQPQGAASVVDAIVRASRGSGASPLGGPPGLDETVAMHTSMGGGMTAAGSPNGIGWELSTPNDHPNVKVANIDSVWQGGRNVGWIYTGSDKQKYFQANYQYGGKVDAAIDPAQLLGKWVNKIPFVKYVHLNLSSNDASVGRTEVLRDQARGCRILKGFDPSAKVKIAHDGYQRDGMPISVGDTIPNGTAEGTTVIDVNLVSDEGRPAGFMYRASDGHRYVQLTSAGGNLPIGIGAKGFGVDFSEARYGEIKRFDGGLPTGTSLKTVFPDREPLIGEGVTG